MEHLTIAALAQAEHDATRRDPHDQIRRNAMTVRSRRVAARHRALFAQRIRTALAGALHRAAELIEPRRCADSPLAADHS